MVLSCWKHFKLNWREPVLAWNVSGDVHRSSKQQSRLTYRAVMITVWLSV